MTGRVQPQRAEQAHSSLYQRRWDAAFAAARLAVPASGGLGAPAAQLPAALVPLDEELAELIDSIVAGELRARRQQQQQQSGEPSAEQQSSRGPPHRIPPSECAAFPQPQDCAFLRPGQQFEGRQRVASFHGGPGPKQEHWEVAATVQHYDRESGYIAGTMEARNVPEAQCDVTTFYEGHVIDNINATFYTADWDACADTDFKHWSLFPGFSDLHAEVVRHGGRCPSLAAHPYVYMRWKELFFVRGSECRLTIQGFYYLCLDRATGELSGFYFDPASSPDQKLDLAAVRAGPAGYAFPHYDLA